MTQEQEIRRAHPYFMYDAIQQQPQAIEDMLRKHGTNVEEVAANPDLDGHGYDNSVKGLRLEGQGRVTVHVMNNVLVQVRVVGHFWCVEAQSHHPHLGVAWRPMGTPATHQVQNRRIGWYQILKYPAHGLDGILVDVDDESGR